MQHPKASLHAVAENQRCTSSALLKPSSRRRRGTAKYRQSKNGRRHAAGPEVHLLRLRRYALQKRLEDGRPTDEKIAQYTESELNVDGAKAYELYKTHGTCLKGLLAEGLLPRDSIEEYLAAVHDVSLEEIGPRPGHACRSSQPAGRRRTDSCSRRPFPNTRSDALERVGVDDLFTCIIDTRTCDLETKHSDRLRGACRQRVGSVSACMLIDDSVKNIRTAKSLGWTTVLIGKHERDTGNSFTCPEADYHLIRCTTCHLRSPAPVSPH